jgi:hypothetical protein
MTLKIFGLNVRRCCSLASKVADPRAVDNGIMREIELGEIANESIYQEHSRFEGVLPGVAAQCFAARELEDSHPRCGRVALN